MDKSENIEYKSTAERELAESGIYATNTVGHSMEPFLSHHRDVVVIARPESEPKRFDVVLYAGKDKWKLNLLNHQEISPPIPIYNMSVTINMGDKKVQSVTSVTGEEVNWAQNGSSLTIKTNLEVFKLLLIK